MQIPGQVKLLFGAAMGLGGLFFSTMGLLALVTAVKKDRINRQRGRFEPVEARVLESEVKTAHSSSDTYH